MILSLLHCCSPIFREETTFFQDCCFSRFCASSLIHQTDARADQDALLEALEVLSEQACRYLLAAYGTTSVTAASVWNAVHAVRRLYRGAMVSGVDEGSPDDPWGFTEKVKIFHDVIGFWVMYSWSWFVFSVLVLFWLVWLPCDV